METLSAFLLPVSNKCLKRYQMDTCRFDVIGQQRQQCRGTGGQLPDNHEIGNAGHSECVAIIWIAFPIWWINGETHFFLLVFCWYFSAQQLKKQSFSLGNLFSMWFPVRSNRVFHHQSAVNLNKSKNGFYSARAELWGCPVCLCARLLKPPASRARTTQVVCLQ